MAQRIDSIDVIEDPRLKKFLEDNDYSKVFDLEEENISIVRFKDTKETRRNISERYFRRETKYSSMCHAVKRIVKNSRNCRDGYGIIIKRVQYNQITF